MKKIAVITARSGSKRIPKKNIKEFCGRPIIAYSIETAISSGLFDEVMVSTDSAEIALIAKEYGAVVPFYRSSVTSNDFATTSDVLEEVINRYHALGKNFDIVCCIYPTAPFITPQKLKDALSIFIEEDANCVTPVVRFSFPPQRAFIKTGNEIVFQYPENAKARSQDLEPLFHDCGQFYVIKTSALMKYHTIVPPKTVPFEVLEEEVQDIDNESDWHIAELKYLRLFENK